MFYLLLCKINTKKTNQILTSPEKFSDLHVVLDECDLTYYHIVANKKTIELNIIDLFCFVIYVEYGYSTYSP